MAGVSGGGKSWTAKLLCQACPQLKRVVTVTTRAPREGEKRGVDYFFVSLEKFQQMVKAGQLLEWAQYDGNYYGTPLSQIERLWGEGHQPLLIMDTQGVDTVIDKGMPCQVVFLDCLSNSQLYRLSKRLCDTKEVSCRMNHAQSVERPWAQSKLVEARASNSANFSIVYTLDRQTSIRAIAEAFNLPDILPRKRWQRPPHLPRRILSGHS